MKTLWISVPGSKSYTNRALLLASLANGKSVLKNCLESDDTKVMQSALRALGVRIVKRTPSAWEIHGCGGKFRKPSRPLFLKNAGTAVRFLSAVLATQDFEVILTGNKRMQERPIGDLAKAMKSAGVKLTYLRKKGFPPIKIQGPLHDVAIKIKGDISSQFLSGLLMAGPLVRNGLTVRLTTPLVSEPYVDMTISAMKQFGASVKKTGKKIFAVSPLCYKPSAYSIEGDASSASYFWGLAVLTRSKIGIRNIPKNSKQADIGFLEILKKMGCAVRNEKNGISIEGPLRLKPLGKINLSHMPDSAMTVALLCAFADGSSTLVGLKNLRVKESDRLHALATELKKIGARVTELQDGLKISGSQKNVSGASISTYNDHRIAMCFGMAKAKIPDIVIQNPECVSKTYPHYWSDFSEAKRHIFRSKNIILTGMRGSGKSTLGKLLAKKLSRPFVDLDILIEKTAGADIPTLVQKFGWSSFRILEKKMVKKLAMRKGLVIATGGGTLMDEQNVEILKQNGIVIFLRAPVSLLWKRLKQDYYRPSLTGKSPLQELGTIWKQREKKYEMCADYTVDIKNLSIHKNFSTVWKLLLLVLGLRD